MAVKHYRLMVRHELLFTRAALKCHTRIRVATLLVDTGATYTILSREVLLSLRLDPSAAITRRPLMTANGLLVLPEVEVDELYTLGQRVTPFPVLAHTIPLGSQVDGVLGMNFLRRFELELHFKQGAIRVEG